jgi:transposase
LHRAGELVAIRIPTVGEEAVRDLCRTGADMVCDLTRARNRLGKFLLRHGRPWRGGSTPTHADQAWLRSQRFDQPAMTQTFGHYLAVVEVRNAQLGALTLAAEVADWRRFAHASQFMGFVRAGAKRILRWQPGPPWPADQGRQRAPAGPVGGVGPVLEAPALGRPGDRPPPARPRPGRSSPRAWAAQQRLCTRFRTLAARTHTNSIVAAAIARELAGFLWAEMTAA